MVKQPIFRLSGLMVLMLACTTQAQDKEIAGTVLAARGEVKATDLVLLEDRPLARRSQVFNIDRVLTGAASQTQLRMSDNALISLAENSELVIAEYQYNDESGEGRVIMELVSGGLRTLTGLVSPVSGDTDYELRTAAASIGIRGTTYEVKLVDNQTFLAVWDGEIEVRLASGTGPEFLLGDDQDFAYASVDDSGEVTFYLEVPDVFAEDSDDSESDADTTDASDESDSDTEDESSDDSESSSDTESSDDSESSSDTDSQDAASDGDTDTDSTTSTEDTTATTTTTATSVETVVLPPSPQQPVVVITGPQLNLPTPPSVIAAKTGTLTYDNLLTYNIPDFDYVMTLSFKVNFTTGTIDSGELTLNSTSEFSYWFALFEGGIEGNKIQGGSVLNNAINFSVAEHMVSHGNFEASGTITGTFHGNNAQQVNGTFELTDTQIEPVTVTGTYQVGR
ncbi:FecR domain-containing protein [Salinispirillum sp. LH 10-3-1]|uniref:FecR domain-containing protein n=1 Tax=Salinispirillum sp. LH 10-3-1 TaxID=2952525 RepID=A0AB38YJJ2_9GAMM